MPEPLRRPRPKADLNAIHEHREQLEALGFAMERGEELHRDKQTGAEKVIYTVSKYLPARHT